MKIIKPSYEIRTDIPGNGVWVLKDLEEDARTCYESEDRITEDGESARKLIKRLIDDGHEAAVEGFVIKVRFVCDRGISHELVRHRLCSFTQESTRYCNYSKGKFGSEITVIEPVIFEEISQERKDSIFEDFVSGEDLIVTDTEKAYILWRDVCNHLESAYMDLVNRRKVPPEIARSVLPTCLKTKINMTTNLREWRHILEQRTSERAHPEMRRLMIPLLCELHGKIPVIFDDIYNKVVVK